MEGAAGENVRRKIYYAELTLCFERPVRGYPIQRYPKSAFHGVFKD